MHSVSLLGLLLAILMYAISVSPSLLPRRWWWHGFVSGILMAGGYTLGWLLQNIGGVLLHAAEVQISFSPLVGKWVLIVVAVGAALWFIRSVVLSYRSSLTAANLVQMKPVHLGEYSLGVLASLGMAAFLLGLVFLVVFISELVVSWLSQWITPILAWVLGVGVMAVVVMFLSNRVVFRSIMAFFARDAALRNNRTASGIHQPIVPERSGSPQSMCSWQSVGAQGRTFLGRGPGREQIHEVTGQPAMEPVRVYAGMPVSGNDFQAEAALVVREMYRTGGFDRAVVLISVATGSGWVDEWIVQPMEYLTRGNCATVSMQYSYLFSAAIAASEMDICRESARELFAAIRAEINKMPPDDRPLLFVSGESLGAEAAQYPFADFADMTTNIDGALLVGSPYWGPISRSLTLARHRGSPEVAPVFDSGRQVRFVNEPAQLDHDIYGREYVPWDFPRVVFAQHASDPVIWFNRTLWFREPDWLRERVGLDVTPNMRFTFLATYLQVLTDLPMAGTAPGGHGHTYNEELFPVWMRLLGMGEFENRGRLDLRNWVTDDIATAINQAIRYDVDESGRR